MSQNNRKRQHLGQNNEDDEDNRSIVDGANSEWSFNWEEENNTNGIGNANELRELKLKMAAVEAKNQMLESKLENQELKARLQAITEESNLTKLKEENKAIREKLKEVVEKSMKLERSISAIQQKMEEKQQKPNHLEEINELVEKIKDAERKAQMDKNELTEKMAKFEMDFTKKLANLEEQQKNQWDDMEAMKGKMEKNVQIANNELRQRMQYFEKNFADKLSLLEKKQETKLDKKMEEILKKLSLLEKQHQQKGIDELKAKIQEKNMAFDMRKDAPQQNANSNKAKGQTPAPVVELQIGKRLEKIQGNRWDAKKTKAQISAGGLVASSDEADELFHAVYAEKGFDISGDCRIDNFAGTGLYYFEVRQIASSEWGYCVGLSIRNTPDGSCVANSPNCYAIRDGDDYCFLAGKVHEFEWPKGTTNKPTWCGQGNVAGCGLVLSPDNKLAIFFTLNGILMGKKIPISHPAGDRLFPTVHICEASVEANFGNDAAKPFKFDIHNKCPGLVFE